MTSGKNSCGIWQPISNPSVTLIWFLYCALNVNLGLRVCSHDLGTTHCPGQLADPGVNFASVHGLTPVTVHMSFSLPRGNFERRVTRCTTPVTRLDEVTFLHVNRTQKLPRGKSSLAHAHY